MGYTVRMTKMRNSLNIYEQNRNEHWALICSKMDNIKI